MKGGEKQCYRVAKEMNRWLVGGGQDTMVSFPALDGMPGEINRPREVDLREKTLAVELSSRLRIHSRALPDQGIVVVRSGEQLRRGDEQSGKSSTMSK